MKYLSLTAEAETDTTTYHRQLCEGWKAYPHDAFFFTRLADFYNCNKLFNQTLLLSAQQLKMDSTYTAAYMAQCVAHYELQQYDSCIVSAQHTLACDSTYAEAHYYIGASYVNKVKLINLPDHITSRAYKKALAEQQELYKLAEPELENYQRMAPQAQKQWAPLLYKVYLALNAHSCLFAKLQFVSVFQKRDYTHTIRYRTCMYRNWTILRHCSFLRERWLVA